VQQQTGIPYALFDGRFEVAYTPGHASHHVSYLHDGTAFVGDTGGVRITPDALTIPPTPPPDVDIEAWQRSIERLLAWSPERLAMTHFGSSEDVEQQRAELPGRDVRGDPPDEVRPVSRVAREAQLGALVDVEQRRLERRAIRPADEVGDRLVVGV